MLPLLLKKTFDPNGQLSTITIILSSLPSNLLIPDLELAEVMP